MTAIATGTPEITLIDVSGSQVGTSANPFIISASLEAPVVNVNNINNVYVIQGTDFFSSASYVLTSSNGALPNSQVHQTLREAVHLTDDSGPRGASWPTGLFNETGPVPFMTASIWWRPSGLNPRGHKVVEQLVTRNVNTTPVTIRWIVYNADGVTIAESYTDTITYSGLFEISRIRTQP